MSEAPGSERKPPTKAEMIEVLQQNWRAEVESARVYRDLASKEGNAKRKGILERMAEAEERHATRWEQKLEELGAQPQEQITLARRFNRWWNGIAGADIAIRRMEAAEDRDEARYSAQRKRAIGSDEEAEEILRKIALEEKAHAKILNSMAPQLGPRTALDVLMKRERWHGRGGSWVSGAIYGVNDGLGAVFGIVSGVAGATDNARHYILLSGLAGMIASALSMGAGAYLASKSEQEVYEAEISREKREIEENPEEEIEEMSLFYQLQGFDMEDADRMARKLAADPEQMIQAMAQSELGLSEQHFPNPWVSAGAAALSTGIGAFIPIIPFFFMGGTAALEAAFTISLAAHFIVGAMKSLITIRRWWTSGLEMTLVGVIEAAVTYGLGLAFAGRL